MRSSCRAPSLTLAYLKLDRLVKSYDGRVNAVDGISSMIARASSSPCSARAARGKTTNVMMIAGFEEPRQRRDRARRRGSDAPQAVRAQHRVVFQNYACFPHMTVERNVAFPLPLRAFPRAQQAERVREILRPGRARRFADKHPRELSGGSSSASRSHGARLQTLACPPAGTSRSERSQKLTRADAGRAQAHPPRGGITMVYVTHDQTEAMTMLTGSRSSAMAPRADAPPLEVYHGRAPDSWRVHRRQQLLTGRVDSGAPGHVELDASGRSRRCRRLPAPRGRARRRARASRGVFRWSGTTRGFQTAW